MPDSDPRDRFVYLYLTLMSDSFEPRCEKTVFGVSDQV